MVSPAMEVVMKGPIYSLREKGGHGFILRLSAFGVSKANSSVTHMSCLCPLTLRSAC